MKKVIKSKVIDVLRKYKYYIFLTLIIFILFSVSKYSSVGKEYELYINDIKVTANNDIYTYNEEVYLHIDDLTHIFSDNIYYEKLSGKLIITTYDKVHKYAVYGSEYIIENNNAKYCNIQHFMTELEYNVIENKNKIYIVSGQNVEGTVLKNRTEIYDKTNNNVICHLEKDSIVNVYNSENNLNKDKMLTVEAIVDGTKYYGYVLSKNIEYQKPQQKAEKNNNKVIIVKAEEKLATNDLSNVDMVAISLYRLSGERNLVKLDNTYNIPKNKKVLVTINNGQKSSNYDKNIISRMLGSEANRNEIVVQIMELVKLYEGINLDFSNFKVTDKENYTQFIKELAASLHAINKILVVNVPSIQYIDCEQVAKVVDYLVIQPYNERTQASKISGPISSIKYVEDWIQNIINEKVDSNKIILEVPAYTILWTERNGTVINAEQYTMKTMLEYLKANNIQMSRDNSSKQNHMIYTKGITTYKMWLEDEYSIIEKTKLASKYNLVGISLYKSGMEQDFIYGKIELELNKTK